jgi:hypothetical protein
MLDFMKGSMTSKDVGLYEGFNDIKGCWITGQVLDVVDIERQGSLTNTTTTNVYICRHTDINGHLTSVQDG